jgi:hypothetical protein
MVPLPHYLTQDELKDFFDAIGSSRERALFRQRGEPLNAPTRLAAASERSMMRVPPASGPRSLIRTTTGCFVRRFVTFTLVPRGKERCAAVNCCREKRSPLAVVRP